MTNLPLGIGHVLSKGEAAMTYIDTREVSIEAAFPAGQPGRTSTSAIASRSCSICCPAESSTGAASAMGYGVGNRDVDARTGLGKLSLRSQSGWIRSPQPMPVRIEFDPQSRPVGPCVGSQAKVMVYPGGNLVMNAIGYVRMRRIAAVLAYVQ